MRERIQGTLARVAHAGAGCPTVREVPDVRPDFGRRMSGLGPDVRPGGRSIHSNSGQPGRISRLAPDVWPFVRRRMSGCQPDVRPL